MQFLSPSEPRCSGRGENFLEFITQNDVISRHFYPFLMQFSQPSSLFYPSAPTFSFFSQRTSPRPLLVKILYTSLKLTHPHGSRGIVRVGAGVRQRLPRGHTVNRHQPPSSQRPGHKYQK